MVYLMIMAKTLMSIVLLGNILPLFSRGCMQYPFRYW